MYGLLEKLISCVLAVALGLMAVVPVPAQPLVQLAYADEVSGYVSFGSIFAFDIDSVTSDSCVSLASFVQASGNGNSSELSSEASSDDEFESVSAATDNADDDASGGDGTSEEDLTTSSESDLSAAVVQAWALVEGLTALFTLVSSALGVLNELDDLTAEDYLQYIYALLYQVLGVSEWADIRDTVLPNIDDEDFNIFEMLLAIWMGFIPTNTVSIANTDDSWFSNLNFFFGGQFDEVTFDFGYEYSGTWWGRIFSSDFYLYALLDSFYFEGHSLTWYVYQLYENGLSFNADLNVDVLDDVYSYLAGVGAGNGLYRYGMWNQYGTSVNFVVAAYGLDSWYFRIYNNTSSTQYVRLYYLVWDDDDEAFESGSTLVTVSTGVYSYGTISHEVLSLTAVPYYDSSASGYLDLTLYVWMQRFWYKLDSLSVESSFDDSSLLDALSEIAGLLQSSSRTSIYSRINSISSNVSGIVDYLYLITRQHAFVNHAMPAASPTQDERCMISLPHLSIAVVLSSDTATLQAASIVVTD